MLKEIPNTHGFLASSDGVILDALGQIRNIYENLDGYKTASVLTTDDTWVTFGVHRLVALAHIPCPGDPADLTVNHKDSDKTNNDKDNLEWITAKLNNIHASLSNPLGIRAMLLLWKHGRDIDSVLIDSLQTAVELTECSEDSLWDGIVTGLPVNGWHVEFFGRKDCIPDHLRKSSIPRRERSGRIPSRAVKMKDMVTGEVVLYPTMTSAATAHGVLTGALNQCAAAQTLRLFKKRFMIRYADEDFMECSAGEVAFAMDRGPKEVVAYNSATGSFQIHESAMSFINVNALSKKAVTVRLKRDGDLGVVSRMGEWVFAYMADEITEEFERLSTGPAG